MILHLTRYCTRDVFTVRLFVTAVVLAAAGVIGCSDFGVDIGPLSATADGHFLTLANRSGERVGYFVASTQRLPWIEWCPQLDSTGKASLPPHSSVRISYDDLWYHNDGELYSDATVNWWIMIPRADGYFVVGQRGSFRTGL